MPADAVEVPEAEPRLHRCVDVIGEDEGEEDEALGGKSIDFSWPEFWAENWPQCPVENVISDLYCGLQILA